jgi:hypothetical protein
VKTVIVVGNGPSLNETPLEALKAAGHTMIGVNRIHLRYPTHPWRPDHWVIMDRSNSSETDVDIALHLEQGYTCWVREDLCVFKAFYTHPRLKIVRQCPHIDMDHNPTDDWHLDTGDYSICQQAGSVPTAVQIALLHLGAERIVAVGCDMGFKGNAENHFIKGYINTDFFDNHKAIIAEKNLQHIWRIAKKTCEARGVPLLNATVGGKLASLPRIPLSDLL